MPDEAMAMGPALCAGLRVRGGVRLGAGASLDVRACLVRPAERRRQRQTMCVR
jgi:hypothetical protein